MKKEKIVYAILLTIFVVFCLIFIVQIIQKLIGKSPFDPQLVYVALGIITSYLLVISFGVGKFIGKSNEFMSVSKNTFKRISKDFEKVNKNIKKLGEKIDKKQA